jgi:PIN domain nuclease of toxin-antitoxin system
MIEDRENEVFFSVASLWEIMIKRALGRSSFDVEASVLRRGLLDNGFCELPIESKHVLAVQGLPPLHGDPFDRVLIAQATVEGLLLLTSDDMVARYPGPIRRV